MRKNDFKKIIRKHLTSNVFTGKLILWSRNRTVLNPLVSQIEQVKVLWWLERGGTTRSHLEHGSETPQRRGY